MKLVAFTLILTSVSFALAQNSLKVEEVKEKYGIKPGKYKLISGSKENCIEGEYKLFEGSSGVISLKAGEGNLAEYIHREQYTGQDRDCTTQYKTEAIFNGFTNVESVYCKNVSYDRRVSVKFIEDRVQYKLISYDKKEKKREEIECLLVRVPLATEVVE